MLLEDLELAMWEQTPAWLLDEATDQVVPYVGGRVPSVLLVRARFEDAAARSFTGFVYWEAEDLAAMNPTILLPDGQQLIFWFGRTPTATDTAAVGLHLSFPVRFHSEALPGYPSLSGEIDRLHSVLE